MKMPNKVCMSYGNLNSISLLVQSGSGISSGLIAAISGEPITLSLSLWQYIVAIIRVAFENAYKCLYQLSRYSQAHKYDCTFENKS